MRGLYEMAVADKREVERDEARRREEADRRRWVSFGAMVAEMQAERERSEMK